MATGSLVVARGHYRNSTLHLVGLDLPPAEKREALRSDVGASADLFGLAPPDLPAAELAGQQAVRSVILFLAHVHLDAPATLQRLAFFFQRMQERSEEDLADTTIVLIGNFFSAPLREADASHLPDVLDDAEQLRLAFDSLAGCIATNGPTVAQQAHFVLLPGPTDCTSLQGFLPQPPLVGDHLKTLRARVRRVTLAPNPARLRFCAHEMVVCRQEFLRGMQEGQRQLLDGLAPTPSAPPAAPPAATATSFEKIAKTTIDEAHLAPNTASSNATVLWRLDHHLRLPLLPHTLLLCDTTEPWECFYKGVRVVNPGSFAVNATFLWYTPSDGECSLSRLDGT
ncbi:DNA polymerase epsilon subunit 2 [Strigomonas culicis]|uniref:DNA polymerase II subunit 2 n=1 Tax=Strigomonas culicis TaxID=28005 RepID=S9VZW2_9TRYP|nr:DNA polymerase epsilon subunit 2 [Strigomonas culicis]|eukprot:EPY32651.1 DNA polymerase epsilon subunit 2 [Strigomonas culicis]